MMAMVGWTVVMVTIAIGTVTGGCGGNSVSDNNDGAAVVVEMAALAEVAVVVSAVVMEPVGVMLWQSQLFPW